MLLEELCCDGVPEARPPLPYMYYELELFCINLSYKSLFYIQVILFKFFLFD